MENKIYLLIPFEKKDELKKLHKIKWDADLKLWYVPEYNENLKSYTIKEIQVDYEDKDIMKSKYKSMRWNKADKFWTCSYDDYLNFVKEEEK